MNVVQRRRRVGGLLAIALASVVAACAEDLETQAGCPALCVQNVPVRDTVLSPFALDTTIAGYPLTGTETGMLLAARGDTIDTRIILRFDSLTTTFLPTGDTVQLITRVDTAHLRLALDPAGAIRRGTLTVEAYDVDTAATDTAAATMLALFRPERLLGSITLPGESIVDSLRIPLDTAKLLSKIRDSLRLRIGVKLRGTQSAQLRVRSQEGSGGAVIRYRPPGDTSVKVIAVGLLNETPAVDERTRSELADFIIVVRGTPLPVANEISVGGLPARRAYFRFGVPSRIIDSTNVIRATLLLTQRPLRGFGGDDTLTVQVQLSTAGSAVTDVVRSIGFAAPLAGFRANFPALTFTTDSVRVVASDSGVVSFDLAGLFQFWRASGPTTLQRAIILKIQGESSLPAEMRVFSTEAAASVRPALRITYVPGRVVGLP
jgi:hypothetical protein